MMVVRPIGKFLDLAHMGAYDYNEARVLEGYIIWFSK